VVAVTETRRRLAQELGVVAGFDDPVAALEQYHTPPDLAANIVHVADLQGDIEDELVLDLGCGTGMLALGAALRSTAARAPTRRRFSRAVPGASASSSTPTPSGRPGRTAAASAPGPPSTGCRATRPDSGWTRRRVRC
jgi:hypothetical protein